MRLTGLRTRQAQPEDATALAALLNRVVDEGDKTAIHAHLDEADFRRWFIEGEHCLGCVVAETADGEPVGFQAYERYHSDLPRGWADIGTFVDREARGAGVGRALFDATLDHALTTGTSVLRAVIRARNTQAIAYYRARGFHEPGPLAAGAPADPASTVLCREVP